MKKIIIWDVFCFVIAGLFDLLSQLVNVTKYSYPFFCQNRLNLIYIFRYICYIFLAVFITLLITIVISKVRKKELTAKVVKQIILSSFAVIICGSAIAFFAVNSQYKSYGNDIVMDMSNNPEIGSLHNSSFDAEGVQLFGTKTMSIKVDDWDNSATLYDYVYSDSESIIEQFLMQYRAAQGVYLDGLYEKTEYKGLTVYQHHTSDDLSSIGLTDSVNETNYYLVKEKNACLYMMRSTGASNQASVDKELENLYLIYTSLTNDKPD